MPLHFEQFIYKDAAYPSGSRSPAPAYGFGHLVAGDLKGSVEVASTLGRGEGHRISTVIILGRFCKSLHGISIFNSFLELGSGLLEIGQDLLIEGALYIFEYSFAALGNGQRLVDTNDFTRTRVGFGLVHEITCDELVIHLAESKEVDI